MLKDLRVVRTSAHIASDAADIAREAYAEGRIEHEPEITDRMLGAIESCLNYTQVNGLVWQAKTFTSRGRNAQETQYGADFMGVLDVDLPNYKVTKGFLAQAKRLERDQPVYSKARNQMTSQCEAMLSRTCESFLFVYSREEFGVVPAVAVLASNGVNPWGLYPKAISTFFELHFESFIGDPRISAPNEDGLRALSEEFRVGKTLWLRLGLTNTLVT